jgi:hypothetical protein
MRIDIKNALEIKYEFKSYLISFDDNLRISIMNRYLENTNKLSGEELQFIGNLLEKEPDQFYLMLEYTCFLLNYNLNDERFLNEYEKIYIGILKYEEDSEEIIKDFDIFVEYKKNFMI